MVCDTQTASNRQMTKFKPSNAACWPPNVSEPQVFLGLVNFGGKFMNILSTALAPLYELSRKGAAWRWGNSLVTTYGGLASIRSWKRRAGMCLECQETQKMSASKSKLHSWEWPEMSWSCLRIDNKGPVLGKTLLIIIDAHSK